MHSDGWRHLAMALNKNEIGSWDKILIHSLYKNYDPWFIWHQFLKIIIILFNKDNVHIVVNLIVYFSLSSWYFLTLKQFAKINIYFIILISIFTPILNERYFQLRPDIVIGLLMLYLIIKKNIITYTITILLAPLYYLFWFFLGYLALIKIVLKDYKSFFYISISIFIGFLIYFLYDYEQYIYILKLVFSNDQLTSKFTVNESLPVFIPLELKNYIGSASLLFILFSSSVFCLYKLKIKNKLLKYFILFLPLMLIQNRFFDLLQPLFITASIIISIKIKNYVDSYGIKKPINHIKTFIDEKTYFSLIKKKHFPILLFIFLLGIFIYIFISYKNKYTNQYQYILSHKFIAEKEFHNKRIFINKMYTLMDVSFLFNPTAQYLPNFSLGWVDYNTPNKKIYFKILSSYQKVSQKELIGFLKLNEIDYFIIDTKFKTNLTVSNKEMKHNGYKFYKIIDDYIIFKRDN